ncbi:MAG: glycosyltransferase [Planctomycetes bacterium]|nr:glycosyltransferase [Planctomycetota bacterium]
MRVLIATNYLHARDGASEVARLCGDSLEALGHGVIYLTSQDPRNPRRPEAKHFVRPTVLDPVPRDPRARLRLAANLLWSREARARIEALLDEFPVDAALLHNVYHHLSPSIIGPLARRRIPFALWLHDYKLVCPSYTLFTEGAPCARCVRGWPGHAVVHRCVKGSRAKSLLCAIEASLHRAMGVYRRAARFIAPSAFLASILRTAGFPGRKIEILPTPARPWPARSLPAGDGPAGEGILYLGRLSEEKGVRVLLDAMARLDDPPPLDIAGDGPLRADLEGGARARGVAARFLGHLDPGARDRAIDDALAVILPSIWYENSPVVIREAHAAGKPVVASRIGGIPEIVRDGDDGILVPPGDARALAGAIASLSRDPERARRMGARGRCKVEAEAGLDAYGRRVAALCDAILEEASAARRGSGRERIRRRRIRVALVGARGIPARAGGVERSAEEIGARLAARGARVIAFVRPRYLDLPYRLPRRLPPYRGVERASLPALASSGFEAASHVLLASIVCAARRADAILYLHLGPGGFAAIPRLFGIPAVLTIQGLDWKRAKWEGARRLLFRRILEPLAIRSADRIIVVSEALGRYVGDRYGRKTLRIPNGVEIRPAPPARVIEEEFGLAPRGYFLFLARLVGEKRPDLAIEAFRSVETPLRLVIAGGGDEEYETALRSLAEGDPRILFAGPVAGRALEALQAHAYAYILPSEIEGLAISLLEALRFDVPAIVSDIPENAEVVLPPAAPKPFALAFRSGDAGDLARCIARLAGDPALRGTLARGARAHVAARYDWDRIAGEVWGVILDAMARRQGTRTNSVQAETS